MNNENRCAVIGAGLMGHGIALTLARAGNEVSVTDLSAVALASLTDRITSSLAAMGLADSAVSILKRVRVYNTVAEAVSNASYVIEAGPEKLAIKQKIFAEIEARAPAEAILASNTSVIPITKIMAELKGRNRALGTHWWNPPHMIPLVEVIKTEWTDDSFARKMFVLLENAGKSPVMVEKDVPGFIGNRLQHALWREAISLVEKGVCDAKSVDAVIKASFGRRLSVLGPLENADLVGTDLTLDIHENVLFDLESRKGPSPYLRKLVENGRLGMKSGEGFRTWTKEEADETRNRVGSHLKKLETILKE